MLLEGPRAPALQGARGTARPAQLDRHTRTAPSPRASSGRRPGLWGRGPPLPSRPRSHALSGARGTAHSAQTHPHPTHDLNPNPPRGAGNCATGPPRPAHTHRPKPAQAPRTPPATIPRTRGMPAPRRGRRTVPPRESGTDREDSPPSRPPGTPTKAAVVLLSRNDGRLPMPAIASTSAPPTPRPVSPDPVERSVGRATSAPAVRDPGCAIA